MQAAGGRPGLMEAEALTAQTPLRSVLQASVFVSYKMFGLLLNSQLITCLVKVYV